MSQPDFQLYTDGGASPNPGPGGWAAILVAADGSLIEELSGAEAATTNNRMELTAAIAGLDRVPPGAKVALYTDSRYVRSGITEWIPRWIRNGWRRGDEAVKNVDLWQQLHALDAERRVAWHWLKGHAGHRLNERADTLASQRIAEVKARLAGAAPTPVAPKADLPEALIRVSAEGGLGVWAVLICRDGVEQDLLRGSERGASANRLELAAGVAFLETTGDGAEVAICAGDYLRRGATEWLPDWRSRAWTTAAGDPVKNIDLWRQVEHLVRGRRIHWREAVKKGPWAARLKQALNRE